MKSDKNQNPSKLPSKNAGKKTPGSQASGTVERFLKDIESGSLSEYEVPLKYAMHFDDDFDDEQYYEDDLDEDDELYGNDVFEDEDEDDIDDFENDGPLTSDDLYDDDDMDSDDDEFDDNDEFDDDDF